jgi:hypothetical protein
MNRLREFALLRNNLLHGRLYERWVLLGPAENRSRKIVDYEDKYEWGKTLTETNFSDPLAFFTEDARKALQILLDVMQYVAKHEGEYDAVETSSPYFVFDLKAANFDARQLLEQKSGDL